MYVEMLLFRALLENPRMNLIKKFLILKISIFINLLFL